jgi:ubiquinone/menaquinone biosynthesis C-methylase UbiE
MTRRNFVHPECVVPAFVLAACTLAHAQDAQQNAADARRLIEVLDVRPGSVIAEIGAGAGELTIALAKAVGEQGRVYSNELNPKRLDDIRKAADAAGLPNVVAVEGKEGSTSLPDRCCDGIFMRDVYHHFSDPSAMNASLFQALKPGGLLAIIEFTPPPPSEQTENPPGHRGEDNHHGITSATLEKELKAAGFDILRSSEASRSVFVVARRPRPEGPLTLNGYRQRHARGIDTGFGVIWKEGGPRIDYEIGFDATNAARDYMQTAKSIRRMTIAMNGSSWAVVIDADADILVVTIDSYANFTASKVESRRDLIDVLLMIGSYRPPWRLPRL